MAAVEVFVARSSEKDTGLLGLYLHPGLPCGGKRYESSTRFALRPLPPIALNWVQPLAWDDLDRLEEGECCYCTTTQDVWIRHNGQMMKVVAESG